MQPDGAWAAVRTVRMLYTKNGFFNSFDAFEHPYVPTDEMNGEFRLFRCANYPEGRHAFHQALVREEDYQKLLRLMANHS